MSSNSATVDGAEEVNENVIRLIGAGSGVMNFVAFTAVSYFLFESNWLVFGLLIGLLSGLGSHLFIPWILRQQNEATDETDDTGKFDADSVVAEHREDESDGVQTAALGAGLEAAGIGMLAVRIALEDLLLGIGGGIAVGLVAFLVASIAFTYGT